jgi:nucleotide-binding universal stress UspA family protein
MALRKTADRVEAQMQRYRELHGIEETWPVAERILLAVSSSPGSQRLVRATSRLAGRLRAEWLVVYVETSAEASLPEKARDRVWQTLRLAEKLGAETAVLSGDRPSDAILQYARRRNVSKIVLGKPVNPRWKDALFGSVRDDLERNSGDIDVYVISGEEGDGGFTAPTPVRRTSSGRAYLWSLGVVALCTGICSLLFGRLEPTNLVMVYLLGVVGTATWLGRGPSVLAAVLSVAAFDFFFVQPHLTFAVSDTGSGVISWKPLPTRSPWQWSKASQSRPVRDEHHGNRQQAEPHQLAGCQALVEQEARDEGDADNAESQVEGGHLGAVVRAETVPRGGDIEDVLRQDEQPTGAKGRPEADAVPIPQVPEPCQRHQATRQKHQHGNDHKLHHGLSSRMDQGLRQSAFRTVTRESTTPRVATPGSLSPRPPRGPAR